MPTHPAYFSVKNFERYQHYKDRNPPWIKLYRDFISDYELRQLSVEARLTYIGCLILASETLNRIPNDDDYLSQRLGFHVTKHTLTTLFSSHFLLALSNSTRKTTHARLGEERRGETETEKRRGEAVQPSPNGNLVSDELWLEEIRTNPAYCHIDLQTELGKMMAWLSLPKNKHRKRTKQFVLNWLNKIDRAVVSKPVTTEPPEMTREQRRMLEREGKL